MRRRLNRQAAVVVAGDAALLAELSTAIGAVVRLGRDPALTSSQRLLTTAIRGLLLRLVESLERC